MRITSSLIAIAVAVAFAPQIHGQEEASANVRLKRAGGLLESLQVTKRPLTTEDKSENEKTAEELASLRQQFTDLVSAYQSGRKTSDLESDWKVKFSDVERTLARLIGGGFQLPTAKVGTAVVAGAVGTAGNIEPAPTDAVANAPAATVSTIGIRDLDPAIRSLLEKFRVELELFYTAPIGETGQGGL